MRDRLAAYMGQRRRYKARFIQHGWANPPGKRPYQTSLLRDIRDADGEPLCDHLWVREEPRLIRLAPRRGEAITFTAQVRTYPRFGTDETEYTLGSLANVEKEP